MSYIVFNRDGSIYKSSFPSFIQQGSSGVNKFCVGIKGVDVDSENILITGTFRLPNSDTSSVIFENETFTIGSGDNQETFNGASYTLTEAQTYYKGILLLSIAVKFTSSEILWTYPAKVMINETTYQPEDEDSKITNAQYNSLLNFVNTRQTNLLNNIDKFRIAPSFEAVEDAELTDEIQEQINFAVKLGIANSLNDALLLQYFQLDADGDVVNTTFGYYWADLDNGVNLTISVNKLYGTYTVARGEI